MITELGHFALILAFLVACVQAVVPMVGAQKRWPGWMAVAEPAATAQFLLVLLSFAALTANQNEDPSMVNPRFLGIDKENKPYSITADLARNLAAGSSSVELEMPKADITLEDGTWLVLTAKNGIFRQAKNTLDLTGAVNLFHDSGYEFQTTEAKIDLKKGLARGSKPVRGQGPFGEMQGEGFRLIGKGKTIVFTGKSKLVIYSESGKLPR